MKATIKYLKEGISQAKEDRKKFIAKDSYKGVTDSDEKIEEFTKAIEHLEKLK